MKYMIFFIMSFAALAEHSIDIINRTDNSVTIGCDFQEDGYLLLSKNEISSISGITKGILFKEEIEINNEIIVDPDVWELFRVKKDELYNFTIIGLKDKTPYFINFQSNDSFKQLSSFTTLEITPIKPASNIIFRKTEPGSIELTWRNGMGSRRLVLMRKGDFPDLPSNGMVYNAGKYGSDSSRIGFTDTYVIFNGSKPKNHFIKIDSLEYDNYYFNVIEYNGSGNLTNYLPGENRTNPRNKASQLPPPIALEEIVFEDNVAFIKWIGTEGIKYYELQVAKDPSFTSLLEEYTDSDVGSNEEFAIYLEDKNRIYYWRIRAVGKYGRSDYSNIIEVNYNE